MARCAVPARAERAENTRYNARPTQVAPLDAALTPQRGVPARPSNPPIQLSSAGLIRAFPVVW